MTRLSVIIPAYNEQEYLPRLLDSIDTATLNYGQGVDSVEVIVADNASTDATAQIATDRGCKVVLVSQRTIAAARNGGANRATGDVYCFIDADNWVHPDTFSAIHQCMQRGDCAGGATGWVLERSSFALKTTELLMRSLIRLAGVDSGLVFCRADIFKQVGGYNEHRQYAEDVEFFRAMRRVGKQQRLKTVVNTPTPAVVSTRKFDTHGDWHMFRMLFWIPLRYGSMKNLVQAYWYSDKERF